MTLRTFDEWSKMGYRIIKGSHHVDRNLDNEPLFDEMQVWHPSDYDDREEDSELADFYGINPWGT